MLSVVGQVARTACDKPRRRQVKDTAIREGSSLHTRPRNTRRDPDPVGFLQAHDCAAGPGTLRDESEKPLSKPGTPAAEFAEEVEASDRRLGQASWPATTGSTNNKAIKGRKT